ncbi:MAG: MAPEG family protein [Pseudomonadota bacterium]
MDLNLPLYSAYLGAFLITLQTLLAASVGGYRGRNRKGVGHEDDIILERRVRRHANMTEYAPIFLTVLAIYEILAGQTSTILVLAIVFAAARLFHVIGFSSSAGSHLVDAKGGRAWFVYSRMLGAGFTLLSSLALAGLLVAHLASLS